jgi:hypothetical protein
MNKCGWNCHTINLGRSLALQIRENLVVVPNDAVMGHITGVKQDGMVVLHILRLALGCPTRVHEQHPGFVGDIWTGLDVVGRCGVILIEQECTVVLYSEEACSVPTALLDTLEQVICKTINVHTPDIGGLYVNASNTTHVITLL